MLEGLRISEFSDYAFVCLRKLCKSYTHIFNIIIYYFRLFRKEDLRI